MKPDGDENQNTPNTAPNADPTQQAVFTPNTPQPSAPAQNQQVITGSVVEPTSTGLSHQYYSNHPTKTSASGIGDIVIKGKRLKKALNKKFLIVAGVALALAVIIGITLSSVIRSNAPKAFENSFRNYVGFLLYEDPEDDTWTRTDQSDDYMTMQNYALYQQFYEPEHTEYFNTLTNFFDKFVSKYKLIRGKLDTSTNEFIDQYIENYHVLNILSKTPSISYVSIQELFEESSENEVWSWVESNFSDLKNYEPGKDYYDMVSEYVELAISGEDNAEVWEKRDSLYNKLALSQSYLISSLQQGCWGIWEMIMEQDNNAQ